MSEEIKRELNELIKLIIDSVDVTAIYLFGSYAYGNFNAHSDFDLYVVIPDFSLRSLEATQKIRVAICKKQKRPIDLLVGKESVFYEKSLQPTIEQEIVTKGIKIYEKSKYSSAMA